MAGKKGFPEFEFKLPNFDMAFWDKFKVPGVDTTALMESQKKNFDALVKANQKAAEGYQNLMRRQTEILTETIQSIQEAAGELMKANAGRELPKKQAAWEKTHNTSVEWHPLRPSAVTATKGVTLAVEADFALLRTNETHDRLQRRGLARAISSEQYQHLARIGFERNFGKNMCSAVIGM